MGNKPGDHFSDLTCQPGSSALAELFKLTECPDVISFAGGFPAPEMFLPEEAAEVTRQLFVEKPSTVLGYSPTPGFSALREILAERQSHLGMPAAAGEIMVTSGYLQGLDILGRVFLDPGDRIIVEAPTYLGAPECQGECQGDGVIDNFLLTGYSLVRGTGLLTTFY